MSRRNNGGRPRGGIMMRDRGGERKLRIDRQKICPLLLRVFCKLGEIFCRSIRSLRSPPLSRIIIPPLGLPPLFLLDIGGLRSRSRSRPPRLLSLSLSRSLSHTCSQSLPHSVSCPLSLSLGTRSLSLAVIWRRLPQCQTAVLPNRGIPPPWAHTHTILPASVAVLQVG
jgi:hypothetical protein